MNWTVTKCDGTVDVERGGSLLARYRARTEASKPHFDVLALPPAVSPAGRNLLLAAPHDHVWHLGLFFCQKFVDGLDCWESEARATRGVPHGRAAGRGPDVSVEDGTVLIEQTVDWRDERGEHLLVDERAIRLHPPTDDGYLLTWDATLRPAGGTRHLSSESRHGHYSGLSVRLARDLAGGHVRLSDGDGVFDPADDATGASDGWCDYAGTLDGRVGSAGYADPWTAGVTLFQAPDDDRDCRWFAMGEDFGFVAANPTWDDVVRLEPDESVHLRWGVWVHAGTPDADRIDAVYERFRATS